MSKFSSVEKDELVEICRRYPDIHVSGYLSDTLQKKRKAWVKVCKDFNSQNPGRPPRDVKQLQGLWKRIKIAASKENDDARKNATRIGEDPPATQPSETGSIVVEIIGDSQEPLPMSYDDEFNFIEVLTDEVLSPESSSDATTTALFKDTPINKSEWRKIKNNLEDSNCYIEQMAQDEHRKKMQILDIQLKTSQLKNKAVALTVQENETNLQTAKLNFQTAEMHLKMAKLKYENILKI